MKRLGHLWNEVLDIENGFIAVLEGTANKRKQWESRRFFFTDEEAAEYPACYHQIDPVKAKMYVAEKLIPQLRDQTWKPKPPRYIRRWCPNKSHAGGKWRDLYVNLKTARRVISYGDVEKSRKRRECKTACSFN